MKRIAMLCVVLMAVSMCVAQAKPAAPPSLAQVMETQLHIAEIQFVPVAEAMPADKYDFQPTGSGFDGVRTFALEVKHVASANFLFFSAILGVEPPAGVSATGATNGPDDLKTKEQIVKFLKDSFALGHKAIATLTEKNALVPLAKPPISFLPTPLALASFASVHDMDHYGQMVIYLRMNGITPPASVGQAPANPKKTD